MSTPDQDRPGQDRPGQVRPPVAVRIAGALVVAEAIGVVVLAVVIAVSGFHNSASKAQLVGQVIYFVLIAAGLGVCGWALFSGRRWGRTPSIVVQIIVLAVGFWLAAPSARPAPGLVVIAAGLITGGLLFTKAAKIWGQQRILPGRAPEPAPAVPARTARAPKPMPPKRLPPGAVTTTKAADVNRRPGKTTSDRNPADRQPSGGSTPKARSRKGR